MAYTDVTLEHLRREYTKAQQSAVQTYESGQLTTFVDRHGTRKSFLVVPDRVELRVRFPGERELAYQAHR